MVLAAYRARALEEAWDYPGEPLRLPGRLVVNEQVGRCLRDDVDQRGPVRTTGKCGNRFDAVVGPGRPGDREIGMHREGEVG